MDIKSEIMNTKEYSEFKNSYIKMAKAIALFGIGAVAIMIAIGVDMFLSCSIKENVALLCTLVIFIVLTIVMVLLGCITPLFKYQDFYATGVITEIYINPIVSNRAVSRKILKYGISVDDKLIFATSIPKDQPLNIGDEVYLVGFKNEPTVCFLKNK